MGRVTKRPPLAYLWVLAPLLAITAWLWLEASAEAPPPPGDRSSAVPSAAAAVASDAAAQDGAAHNGAREASSSAEGLLRDRSDALANAAPPPPDPLKFLVRVVRATDGSPVAGAEVLRPDPDYAGSNVTAEQRNQRINLHESCVLLLHGISTLTDANGYVQLPRTYDGFHVVARKDHWFGCRELLPPEPEGGFLLVVSPSPPATVRLVDAQDHPAAGVLIALTRNTGANGKGQPDQQETFGLGRTDAEGVLAIPTLPELLRLEQGKPMASARLFVGIPWLEQIGMDLDPAKPPEGTLEWQLPPTGSIEVALQTQDRRPLSMHCWFQLVPVTPSPDFPPQLHWHRLGQEGRTRFDHLPLGQDWRATALGIGRSIHGTARGPQLAGQTITIPLPIDARTDLVRGRAIGTDGQPLSMVRLRWLDQAGHARHDTTTNAEGHFVIPLRGRNNQEISGELQALGHRYRYYGLRAVLPTRPRTAGEINLGDLVFTQSPILAAGKLHGIEPLPEVYLHVERWNADAEDGRGNFEASRTAGIALDPSGEFRIYENRREGRFRLTAEAEGCEPLAPIEFAAGATNLDIELRRGANGVARFLVHDSLLAHADLLVCELQAPGSAEFAQWDLLVKDDHLVTELRGIPPGQATLRIRPYGHTTPLAVIGPITITAGQPIRDARLDAIDLRDLVRAVRLRLVDASGTLLENVECLAGIAQATRHAEEKLYFEAGIAMVPAVGLVDLLLLPEDHQPIRHQGPAIDADIVATACLEVTVHLTGLPELPPDCVWHAEFKQLGRPSLLAATPGWQDEDWPTNDLHEGQLDDGVMGFLINAPGDFEVTLSVTGKRSAQLPTKVRVRLPGAGEHQFAVPTAQLQAELATAWKHEK